jgi:xanthine dehydrogenase YagR molybdenum-binding subunit
MTTKSIGSPHTRREGPAKATGAARYAGEIPWENRAHGWIVASTIPRGRVRTVDSRAASSMPGVLAVLHHANAPRLGEGAGFADPDPNLLVLQSDLVPHAGWPVALVVAETWEQARAAAGAVLIDYEEYGYDVGFTADHPGLYTPKEVNLHQPGEFERGDVDGELSGSAKVVDQMYATPEQHNAPMEPHAAIARWHDGRLDVIDSNQGAFSVAQDLAKLFFLTPDAVRVRSEHVGGGFGSKASTKPHVVLAAMAARIVDRPVRVVLTRPQMFTMTGYRPPTVQHIRLGADADGHLRAYDHLTATQTSTVFEYVEPAGVVGKVMYASDALRIRHRVVALDVPTPRWMRGPGEAPGSFALESAMDELAEDCGLDPIELRRRNEPDTAPASGLPFSSRNLLACFDEGAARFGWAGRDPLPRRRQDGRWLLGTGTAAATYPADTAPSTAGITAEPDGTFTVRITAADIGTGARTALGQIAADALAVDVARVKVLIGNSQYGFAILAGHSFGTASWGWAVTEAAEALRAKLTPAGGIPPGGITARADTAAAVRALAKQERHAYGAQFAEVAVDVLSGEVRVRRMLGVFAVGRVVNPLTTRSQLVGGITMGLSMALHEEGVRDRAIGGYVNANLAGYHFAAHADVPHIEVGWVDDADYLNPTGIKGVGEIGIVGAAAAIANAVWHATGERHRTLPIRPDRVLEAAEYEKQ